MRAEIIKIYNLLSCRARQKAAVKLECSYNYLFEQVYNQENTNERLMYMASKFSEALEEVVNEDLNALTLIKNLIDARRNKKVDRNV